MSRNRDEDDREVTGRVTGEVTGEVTGRIKDEPGQGTVHAADGTRSPEASDEAVPEEDLDENGVPLTEEEKRERDTPVAAVPAGVDLSAVEAVDGFRLPRDQPEAEDARRQAEAEYQDASRPHVAQRLADDAKIRAQEAADEAEAAQGRADEVKSSYEGPDRPPLTEGWRYVKQEPDVHDPA
jgi:hypothetical protein